MKQNNMEEVFRNKLKEREISPSANGWSRLNLMLDNEDKRLNKRKKNYQIAAAVVFFLLSAVAFKFVQSDNLSSKTPQEVVVNNSEISNAPQNSIVVEKDEKSEDIERKLMNQNKPKNNVAYVKEFQSSINQSSKKESQIPVQVEIPKNNDVVPGNIINDEDLLAGIKMPSQQGISVKMDASKMLKQAETELNVSYRDQVFQKLKNKYQDIKVAVSERNKE